jgi:hypothetical protein
MGLLVVQFLEPFTWSACGSHNLAGLRPTLSQHFGWEPALVSPFCRFLKNTIIRRGSRLISYPSTTIYGTGIILRLYSLPVLAHFALIPGLIAFRVARTRARTVSGSPLMVVFFNSQNLIETDQACKALLAILVESAALQTYVPRNVRKYRN